MVHPQQTRGPRRDGRGHGRRKSDEDVLIALMQLVRQGDTRAQEAQAQYQRDRNEDRFIARAKEILEEDANERSSSGIAQPRSTGQMNLLADETRLPGSNNIIGKDAESISTLDHTVSDFALLGIENHNQAPSHFSQSAFSSVSNVTGLPNLEGIGLSSQKAASLGGTFEPTSRIPFPQAPGPQLMDNSLNHNHLVNPSLPPEANNLGPRLSHSPILNRPPQQQEATTAFPFLPPPHLMGFPGAARQSMPEVGGLFGPNPHHSLANHNAGAPPSQQGPPASAPRTSVALERQKEPFSFLGEFLNNLAAKANVEGDHHAQIKTELSSFDSQIHSKNDEKPPAALTVTNEVERIVTHQAQETTTPAAEGEVAVTEEGRGTERKPRRTTRNQQARLRIKDTYTGREANVVPPRADVAVSWEAPAALILNMKQPQLALFRLGVSSNQNAVIAKAIKVKDDAAPLDQQGLLRSGSINFYAPRSPGTFVFRLYDADDYIATHGTSRRFVVDVQGREVESNLKVVLAQFKENKTLVAALSQLGMLLRGLRRVQGGKRFNEMLWTAISLAVKQLSDGEDSISDKDERGRSRYPVQFGVATVVRAALSNTGVMSVLNDQQRSLLRAVEALWCPFTDEFYPSEQEKRAFYEETWSFIPSQAPLSTIPLQLVLALSKEMGALLPSLLPSDNFILKREEVRQRIENFLPSLGVYVEGTKLRVFGSSANNFGNDSADLDMCMTIPASVSGSSEENPKATSGEMIEALAEHLKAAGMEDVVPRPTARIPIVLFKDPQTGLDCDVSVENPLALRNTQLLMMYSQVDPRVRALAYVVKHWARCRKINNASEGTLSSYAYILLVIHFLQTRRPAPIVPNLQLLPPDWEGQDFTPQQPGALRSYLPRMLVNHPIEKLDIDTYFYTPRERRHVELLHHYGSRNHSPVGGLLVEFFHYYTWEFDYREHVISVRNGGVVRKEDKAEDDCWPVNSRLAIEDPFETWYNVTHFLKESKHRHIRSEFARAYTLCVEEAMRGSNAVGEEDGDGQNSLLANICEEAPDPPARKMTLEDEEGTLNAAMKPVLEPGLVA